MLYENRFHCSSLPVGNHLSRVRLERLSAFHPDAAPAGVAGQFFGALYLSHYLVVIFLLQLGPAVLLLLNRYVPLALTLLGPIVVNILLFHLLMAPNGLPLAFVVTTLWILTAVSVRSAFRGLLQKTYNPNGISATA